ncbi:MAG: hypothetical protein QXU20_04515 [Candidatus Woesearchaeota archaeon]
MLKKIKHRKDLLRFLRYLEEQFPKPVHEEEICAKLHLNDEDFHHVSNYSLRRGFVEKKHNGFVLKGEGLIFLEQNILKNKILHFFNTYSVIINMILTILNLLLFLVILKIIGLRISLK